MEQLKVGIIGAGSISGNHLHGYAQLPQVKIQAICDLNRERAQKAADQYGAPGVYTDLNEMLAKEQLDAVSVTCWNNAHAEASIAALQAGVNVLCEKPLAMSAKQAQLMVEAEKQSGKLLMVGFVRRFFEGTIFVKDAVDNGDLGDIYWVRTGCIRRCGNPGGWFSDSKRSGGGPVIDLSVHMVDEARYLLGKPKAVSVSAATFNKIGSKANTKGVSWYKSQDYDGFCDVEDAATALVRFDNGAVLNVEVSWTLDTDNERTYFEMFGSKGGAVAEPYIKLMSSRSDYMTDLSPVVDGEDVGAAFDKEIAHFIECIQTGQPCRNPGQDGVELMKILDAIYLSAKEGREVYLED